MPSAQVFKLMASLRGKLPRLADIAAAVVELMETSVSTTVTSHMSNDDNYFGQHDPAQCRSLTLREAV